MAKQLVGQISKLANVPGGTTTARDAKMPRQPNALMSIRRTSDAARAQLCQIYRRGWRPLPGNRDIMSIFVRTVPYYEKLTINVSAEFLPVALFSGIGLLVGLIAAGCGEQGVWF
jgi:hypothetical protein